MESKHKKKYIFLVPLPIWWIHTLFGFCDGFGGSNSSSFWPLGLLCVVVLFGLYFIGVEISISWPLESLCAIAFVR